MYLTNLLRYLTDLFYELYGGRKVCDFDAASSHLFCRQFELQQFIRNLWWAFHTL